MPVCDPAGEQVQSKSEWVLFVAMGPVGVAVDLDHAVGCGISPIHMRRAWGCRRHCEVVSLVAVPCRLVELASCPGLAPGCSLGALPRALPIRELLPSWGSARPAEGECP